MDRGQGKDRVRQGKVNCSPIHLLPAMASLLSHALHFLDLEEGRNNQLSLTYISLHYLHLSLFLVFICHFFLHHLQQNVNKKTRRQEPTSLGQRHASLSFLPFPSLCPTLSSLLIQEARSEKEGMGRLIPSYNLYFFLPCLSPLPLSLIHRK